MKRLSTGALVALMVAGLGLNAVAAPSGSASLGNNGNQAIAQASTDQSMPAANFGSPPSGEIPILFNDHHVYSKPDTLKQGRVLAAIVRGGTLLIPLRSMFEQMGATVSFDPASKTVDVTKPGADVKVTVGKPEVTINGESRPLDVPPEMYQGSVLVPVRVISEGMGAYVQWVPDKRLVVVRYNPATPPPPPRTPAPVESSSPAPTTATAATPYQDHFIAGDYIINPKVYNEFSPGNKGKNSYAVRAALEFNLLNLPWMLEGDYRQFKYPHDTGAFAPGTPCSGAALGDEGCVTTIGQTGQTFVPAFNVRETDFDGRLGLKVADPRLYIGVGYMYREGNYGYPRLRGFGFGAEKLPDLNHAFSLYGSVWYYPNVKGNFTDPGTGLGYDLAYRVLKYQIGGNLVLGNSPVFLDFGFLGDRGNNKSNAPSDFTHTGPYVGLGIKF
ncbi:MAG: copper amine oxidase N-terminal domain-containing protein [Candidatus Eremiobacteraeota bacterium]|nr:copper amine oxidase N-terminal domain-containing protein [Candidatus Eremiobacteraeota bacterium]